MGKWIISWTGLKSGSFRFLRNHSTPGRSTCTRMNMQKHSDFKSYEWFEFELLWIVMYDCDFLKAFTSPLLTEEWRRQSRRRRPCRPASGGTWWYRGQSQNSAPCPSESHQTSPAKSKARALLSVYNTKVKNKMSLWDVHRVSWSVL